MRMFVKRRFLPFVCLFTILISLCAVSVSAAGFGVGYDDDKTDPGSRDAWAAYIYNADSGFVNSFASFFGISSGSTSVFFHIVSGVLDKKVGEVSYTELERLASQLNGWFGQSSVSELYDFVELGSTFSKWTLTKCFGLTNLNFVVSKDSPTAGYYRIKDTVSGLFITDATFNFIDQLIYDESTKTYYIDSHDTYTTNNN